MRERHRKILGELHPSCAFSVYNLAARKAESGTPGLESFVLGNVVTLELHLPVAATPLDRYSRAVHQRGSVAPSNFDFLIPISAK